MFRKNQSSKFSNPCRFYGRSSGYVCTILASVSTVLSIVQAVAQSLRDIDLVFIEEAFERMLLDYDRVFSAMGVPACLWRRTGEIYKGNREFCELVGLDGSLMRDVCYPLFMTKYHTHTEREGSSLHLRTHGRRVSGKLLGGSYIPSSLSLVTRSFTPPRNTATLHLTPSKRLS